MWIFEEMLTMIISINFRLYKDFLSTDFAIESIQWRRNSDRVGVSSGATDQRGTSEGETTAASGRRQRRRESSSGTSQEIELHPQNKEGTTHETLWFPWNRRGTRQLSLIYLALNHSRCVEIFSAKKCVRDLRIFFHGRNVDTFVSSHGFPPPSCGWLSLVSGSWCVSWRTHVSKDHIAGVTSFNDINWSTWMDLRNSQS